MCRLNAVGMKLATLPMVTALTDVTGFGLLGHLLEVCEGSGVGARLDYPAVPVLEPVRDYLAQGAIPGGTGRNFDSYGSKVAPMTAEQRHILCDPQTSGGLLVAVQAGARREVERILEDAGLAHLAIGELVPWSAGPRVELRP
jgi:selenide,water dikinase